MYNIVHVPPPPTRKPPSKGIHLRSKFLFFLRKFGCLIVGCIYNLITSYDSLNYIGAMYVLRSLHVSVSEYI